MVGRRVGEGNNRGDQELSREGQRITSDHRISHNLIRELIQSAIGPLRVDPVPTSVFIHNIVIKTDSQGRLSIECDVSFEVESPV